MLIGGAAQATAEPVIPISGGITITGHGFGHGRGMSQYGAQGRAIQGVKWPQIVGFYYPGTSLASISGDLTVLISADDDADTIVLPKTGLAIADYGAHKVYTLPTNGAKAWKLYVVDGKFKIAYQNNGWHPYAPGGNPTLAGTGEFRTKSYTVTLRTPVGDRAYRGAIRRSHGHTINRTGFESYVKGVVAREMPASWRLEALSAQAVAARTYAAYYSKNPRGTYYDLCDTTDCQVYGGLSDETAKTTQAVLATTGKVLTSTYPDDHGYAITEFSSSNGGWSAAGQTRPYLVAQEDKFEQYASNPYANWSVALNSAALQSRYGAKLGTLKSLQVLARTGYGDWGGRVTDIKLWGTKSGTTTSVTIGGSEFRTVLGLRSTYFTLVP